MPRPPALDWKRVATILKATREEDVACPSCRARGSLPYIAEHVLATHPTTQAGRQLAKLVLQTQNKPR